MFDQVKTFSGLDVPSMLRGEPLYEVKEASTFYSVQLDSSYINLSNVVKLASESTDATQYLNVLTGLGMDLTSLTPKGLEILERAIKRRAPLPTPQVLLASSPDGQSYAAPSHHGCMSLVSENRFRAIALPRHTGIITQI